MGSENNIYLFSSFENGFSILNLEFSLLSCHVAYNSLLSENVRNDIIETKLNNNYIIDKLRTN